MAVMSVGVDIHGVKSTGATAYVQAAASPSWVTTKLFSLTVIAALRAVTSGLRPTV